MSQSRTPFSIVMEMENGRTVSWSEVGDNLRALTAEIRGLQSADGQAMPSLFLVHPGQESDSELLLKGVRQEAPELEKVARVESVSVSDGRYYELKNAGIARADGEVVVLFDSDALPETGWLSVLISPFDDPEITAVNGHTYLQHNCFVSRVFAMIWFFPLREKDARDAKRRAMNANNCAIRASWIKAHPFPIDKGFKVGCTKLMHELRQAGVEMVKVPAYCAHLPLQGWRFLIWRALVTGRDADRKFEDLRSPSRVRRFAHAFRHGFKMQLRAARRVLQHHRHVRMPLWEVPAALSVGFVFYGLAFVGQFWRSLGITGDHGERIPAYAEHH